MTTERVAAYRRERDTLPDSAALTRFAPPPECARWAASLRAVCALHGWLLGVWQADRGDWRVSLVSTIAPPRPQLWDGYRVQYGLAWAQRELGLGDCNPDQDMEEA